MSASTMTGVGTDMHTCPALRLISGGVRSPTSGSPNRVADTCTDKLQADQLCCSGFSRIVPETKKLVEVQVQGDFWHCKMLSGHELGALNGTLTSTLFSSIRAMGEAEFG